LPRSTSAPLHASCHPGPAIYPVPAVHPVIVSAAKDLLRTPGREWPEIRRLRARDGRGCPPDDWSMAPAT